MLLTTSFISRIIPASLLVFAGTSKLINLKWFFEVLRQFDLIPTSRIRLVGTAVVLLELSVGFLLLMNLWLPWSAVVASALFGVFAWAIAKNLLRGRFDIDCGCTGQWGRRKIGYTLVLRNLSLIGLTTFSILAEGRGWSAGSAAVLCVLTCVLFVTPFA
jgi:Methylamine utilisation protein MauE